jgi:hypothetical protein
MKRLPGYVRIAAAGVLAIVMLAACVAAGYDGDDGGVGYVGGYYEPYGYVYGGWGPGYRVGPPRGGAGPRGRAAPSIPRGHGGGGAPHGGGQRR